MDTGLGVKGLIKRDQTVLVLVKPNGELDLPGGRVECCETRKEALIRETLEETGLTVCIQEPVFEWSFHKRSGRQIAGITYFCRHLDGQVQLSCEHSFCYWSPLDIFDHPGLRRWIDHDRPPAFFFRRTLAMEAVTIK